MKIYEKFKGDALASPGLGRDHPLQTDEAPIQRMYSDMGLKPITMHSPTEGTLPVHSSLV